MIRQATDTRRGIPMAMVMVVAVGFLALAFAFVMATRSTSSDLGSAPAQAGSKANNAVAAKVTVRLYDRQFTSTSDQAAAGPRARTRFSSSSDNQLYVQMTWTGVEQTHDAYVTFYSPDGKVYQVLDVPFTTTQPSGGKSASGDLYQNRPGVLHPLKVSRAQITSNGAIVWGQLPIAGTWMGRMPGKWQVEVRLDQHPDVLTKTQFELTR